MYTVIRAFHDLQDGKATKAGMIYHCYEVGDVYPREGLKPSPERIEELSGPHNAQGCPLIATDAAAEATAKLEAAAVLKIIKGKKIDAPAFIDLEDKCQKDLGKEKLKAIALAFTETIKAAGYKAGVYASYDWLTNRIGKIPSGTYVWLAQYPKATYKGRYNFHQHRNNGAVPGFGKIDVDTWTKGGVNR